MSIFDLFRGFFGRPRGHYGAEGGRDPFFDGLTRDDEDDEEADEFLRDDGHRFDDAFRFGFSFGPNGMHIHEPSMFGQIFREMEEIFSGLDQFSPGLPSVTGPHCEQPGNNERGGKGNGNSLRDFMLKSPDAPVPSSPHVAPRDVEPSVPYGPSPFHHWTPFSRFKDSWSDGPKVGGKEKKEDRDLDSQVSSGGLDQILTPNHSQPKSKSFFHSVTVTKVVKPDGTVEERRTVRDGRGNEETTVTRSGGPGPQEETHNQPLPQPPGGSGPFADMDDEFSLFSKFFGSFKS